MQYWSFKKNSTALFAILVVALMGDLRSATAHERDDFLSAKRDYEVLRGADVAFSSRERWTALAERFDKISRQRPRNRYADDALYHQGSIYRGLAGLDKNHVDFQKAVDSWRILLQEYPRSHWVPETRYRLGLIYDEVKNDVGEATKFYEEVIKHHPGGGLALLARQRLDGFKRAEEERSTRRQNPVPTDGKSLLTQVRFTSSKNYTRVIMDLSQEVHYETHLLKEDSSKGLPPRIYVDLRETKLGMSSVDPISVQDGLLRQVRVGQFTPEVVRVVLDMTSLSGHHTFLLPDPYRLVIDIQGQNNGNGLASIRKPGSQSPPAAGAKNTQPGIRKIVLDPGHGGKDPGAIGIGGIAEKDIVLNIAKKLARKLKREMGVEVVLTREDDRFIALEDRTAIANAEDADLFISLHTNASPNSAARGLETYYLDNTNDEASIRLAARENGASRKSISDLQFILSDLTQNVKLEDSITLAHRLHGSLVSNLGRKQGAIRDLGVKKALFYVLVGARMPSVLVELFFITNKSEARAIARESYQNAIVDALYGGIQKYNESTLAVKTL